MKKRLRLTGSGLIRRWLKTGKVFADEEAIETIRPCCSPARKITTGKVFADEEAIETFVVSPLKVGFYDWESIR